EEDRSSSKTSPEHEIHHSSNKPSSKHEEDRSSSKYSSNNEEGHSSSKTSPEHEIHHSSSKYSSEHEEDHSSEEKNSEHEEEHTSNKTSSEHEEDRSSSKASTKHDEGHSSKKISSGHEVHHSSNKVSSKLGSYLSSRSFESLTTKKAHHSTSYSSSKIHSSFSHTVEASSRFSSFIHENGSVETDSSPFLSLNHHHSKSETESLVEKLTKISGVSIFTSTYSMASLAHTPKTSAFVTSEFSSKPVYSHYYHNYESKKFISHSSRNIFSSRSFVSHLSKESSRGTLFTCTKGFINSTPTKSQVCSRSQLFSNEPLLSISRLPCDISTEKIVSKFTNKQKYNVYTSSECYSQHYLPIFNSNFHPTLPTKALDSIPEHIPSSSEINVKEITPISHHNQKSISNEEYYNHNSLKTMDAHTCHQDSEAESRHDTHQVTYFNNPRSKRAKCIENSNSFHFITCFEHGSKVFTKYDEHGVSKTEALHKIKESIIILSATQESHHVHPTSGDNAIRDGSVCYLNPQSCLHIFQQSNPPTSNKTPCTKNIFTVTNPCESDIVYTKKIDSEKIGHHRTLSSVIDLKLTRTVSIPKINTFPHIYNSCTHITTPILTTNRRCRENTDYFLDIESKNTIEYYCVCSSDLSESINEAYQKLTADINSEKSWNSMLFKPNLIKIKNSESGDSISEYTDYYKALDDPILKCKNIRNKRISHKVCSCYPMDKKHYFLKEIHEELYNINKSAYNNSKYPKSENMNY
ncbi:hypothetical protein AYI68_g3907, partial [Smittium mucronatum]